MCKYKVLHENSAGITTLCNNCGELQIKLGNIITQLDLSSFEKITKLISNIYQEEWRGNSKNINRERVIIKTPVNKMWLCFETEEFIAVQELFEMTTVLLSSLELITPQED